MAARSKARPYFLLFPVAFFAFCAPPWFLPVGLETWKIRLACIMVLFPMITAGITYYLLTLNVSRHARGKVSQNAFLKKICQIAVSATAILFAGGIMVPFEWSGLKALTTAQLDSFVGRVADNDCKMGTWSFSQNLTIVSKGNTQSFYYFLCAQPIRVGEQCRFWKLAEFPVILQHEVEK